MFLTRYVLFFFILIGCSSMLQAQDTIPPPVTPTYPADPVEPIDTEDSEYPDDSEDSEYPDESEDSDYSDYPDESGYSTYPTTATTMTVDTQYNLLQISGSPAGDLVGLSAGLIQSPSDPTNFLVRLANTTSNFTLLPAFGMDFSPVWIYGGRRIKYEDFASNKVFKNIWQSMTISTAVNTSTYPDTLTQFALGIKFSLLRGKMPDEVTDLYNASSKILSSHVSNVDSLNLVTLKDSTYQSYLKQMKALAEKGEQKSKAYKKLQKEASNWLDLNTQTNTSSLNQDIDSLSSIASQVNFTRYGFKCDLAAGTSSNYADNLYENGELGNIGAWLTAGYETKSGFSLMGQGKYLYHNPMDVDTLTGIDYSSFDVGAKLNFPNSKGNFSFSIEAVYRNVFDDIDGISSSWGFTTSINYKLPQTSLNVPGTVLSFTFGRGFKGELTGAEPVLATIHFFKGFGSSRPFLN